MFRGSFVAIVTPFTNSGRIDRKALASLVEWHIQEGTDGIVCCGTTGEGCTLSDSERKTVTEICVGVAKGRVPIISGAGTCDTRQSVRLVENAQKAGASGCLIVSPYYNKPTQRGCLAHFQEIGKVGLPIIAYHHPGRTGFRFSLDLVRELESIPEVVSIKDSSGDLEFMDAVCKTSRLGVFAGDDDLTLEVLQRGGVGVISVIGNIIPWGWGQMVRSQSKKLFSRYLPLCHANFIETNPQCVKYVVSQMGRCKPIFRLPMVLPTEETQQEIKRVLLELSLPHTVRVQLGQ